MRDLKNNSAFVFLGLLIPIFFYHNAVKNQTIKEKSVNETLPVINDVALGAFIVKVPSDWDSFGRSEISSLQQQYQEQSNQINQLYSKEVDSSQFVDLAAFHILNDKGTFAIVSFSVPKQSDLITLLKSQIADKMEWGVREGYIKKYLGLTPIDDEHFSGFYTKSIGKSGNIEISGGMEHKNLKNTIIQLTLLCPGNWDDAIATDTMTKLLKSIVFKN